MPASLGQLTPPCTYLLTMKDLDYELCFMEIWPLYLKTVPLKFEIWLWRHIMTKVYRQTVSRQIIITAPESPDLAASEHAIY